MRYLLLVFALIVSTSTFSQAAINTSQMKQLKPRAQVTTVGRKNSVIGKIKTCLAAVYATQVTYHVERGTYISSNQEFTSDTADVCHDIDVTTELANQDEFRVIAKSENEVWSVDQNKEITQLR